MKANAPTSRPLLPRLWLALATLLVLAGCPQQATQSPPCAPAASATAAPTVASTAPAGAPAVKSLRDTPVPSETQVAVVGGGLAGLITAYKLHQAGVQVHVLEATDRIGGRVNTAYYPDGAQGEFGLQEVWEDNPLYEIAKELGIHFEEKAAGEEAYSSFLFDDAAAKTKKPTLYTFTGRDEQVFFQRFLSQGSSAAKATSAYKAFHEWQDHARDLRGRAMTKGLADPEIKRLQDISFEAWIEEAKLDPKVTEFIQMTSDCEIGLQWHQYSALFGLLEFGIFLDDTQTYHSKGGNHRIPEAIAAAIQGHVTTSTRVNRIDLPEKERPGKGEIRIEYMRDGVVSVLRAERVVVAVPWVRLHEIDIRPPLSAAKWKSIDELQRGQYVVVHLLVDKNEGAKLWRDKTTGRAPFPVLSNGQLGVIYGARGEGDPAVTTDVFGLLVYGKWARKLHMMSTAEVQTTVVGELERVWPGFGGVVKGIYVYSYHPAGVPVWGPGRSPIDEKSRFMFQPEHGLYLAGDFLINAHSEGAVRSALCAADRVGKDLAGQPIPNGLCFYTAAGK